VVGLALEEVGRASEAEATLRRACSPGMVAFPNIGIAWALLAGVLARAGQGEAAMEYATRAMATLELSGERPEVRLAHVDALLASGRREDARQAALVARDLLAGVLARIRTPDLRSSRATRNPTHARTVALAAQLA
jgi:hypothetical protein